MGIKESAFRCFFLQLFLFSEVPEKGGQHGAAFFLQDAPFYFDLMVELLHFQKIQDGTGTACFGIHTADDCAGDAGLYDGACTHLTGFQSDIDGAAFQSPVTQLPAGLADGIDLGVGGGIVVGIPAVVAAGNDLILVYNDAADGNFVQQSGFSGLTQGFFHVFFIWCHGKLLPAAFVL